MFIIVGILVAIVIGLLIYNVQIHRKIQEFNSLQRQANNLRVLQDFLSTIGEIQTIITCTGIEDICNYLDSNSKIFKVKNGIVSN